MKPRASAHSRRCATAASRKPRSCGSSRSATNPTSNCGSEAAPAMLAPIALTAGEPRATVTAQRPIALTAGEPSGIGPDLCLAAASMARAWPLVCLADRELLAFRARRLKLRIEFSDYRIGNAIPFAAGTLSVLHQPLPAACVAGRLEVTNVSQV